MKHSSCSIFRQFAITAGENVSLNNWLLSDKQRSESEQLNSLSSLWLMRIGLEYKYWCWHLYNLPNMDRTVYSFIYLCVLPSQKMTSLEGQHTFMNMFMMVLISQDHMNDMFSFWVHVEITYHYISTYLCDIGNICF